MNWFENLAPWMQALIATMFTWGITAIGSLTVCFFKTVNKKVLNTILGFSAGVMLAASFWSLLQPSIDLSAELRLHSLAFTSFTALLLGHYLYFFQINF